MKDLPRGTKKASVATIRSAAGIAGGLGEYTLASQLWALEAQLRFREEPVMNAIDVLRETYMRELTDLIQYGDERSPTKNGVMRGLRQALELLHVPVPTVDEAIAYRAEQLNLPPADEGFPEPPPVRRDARPSSVSAKAQQVLDAAGELYQSMKAETIKAIHGDVDPPK
jgi:hypothetical protein